MGLEEFGYGVGRGTTMCERLYNVAFLALTWVYNIIIDIGPLILRADVA